MKRSARKRSDIRVGVIGYGGAFNMGREHLKAMQAAGMTPCAVAELDPKRLEVAGADFPGIGLFSDVASLLRRSDAALITVITPHSTHYPLGMQCLKAGRHVVLEKPMAITTAECDRMIKLSKSKGLLLSTYHNRHWDGWILQALELLRSGRLGKLVRIELRMGQRAAPRDWWRSSRSLSGGILYDWGVHLIEYALQICESEVAEVSGFATEGFWVGQGSHPYPKDANEDEARAIIRMASGVCVDLVITSLDVEPPRGILRIVGTQGSHQFDWGGFETTVAGEGGTRQTVRGPNRKDEWGHYYDNIAAHLAEKAPLIITPEWSRRTIHILDLAGRSARLGRTLRPTYR